MPQTRTGQAFKPAGDYGRAMPQFSTRPARCMLTGIPSGAWASRLLEAYFTIGIPSPVVTSFFLLPAGPSLRILS